MNIIAVDDNAFALTNLARAIQSAVPKCNLKCFSATDEALSHAKRVPVDIAFLDIEMGETNGLELSKQLKKVNKTINIIFATGYSEYAADAFKLHAGGYLLKPVDEAAVLDALEHLRFSKDAMGEKLKVQTFGNFEVFFNNRPIQFQRRRAKELFAYLIHKRGSGCTLKEIATILFADREGCDAKSLLKQAQNIIAAMVKGCRDCGFEDVIIRGFNNISLDISKVDCDYYRFLQGDIAAVNSYMGEYMSNYDWAEFMIGYLDNKNK